MPKFSVKKPYTVVVGIVLVLILGFVSFTKLSTDLLPSMNFPYAIVMTTYQGASPEQVEMVVTEPVEASMATVSNIKQISSTSSENYSLVILEFNTAANMDSVTIEMRESLDMISAYWPDEVGTPIILKLNPDMMPVMMAALSGEGMTSEEVSRLYEEKISSDLKRIDGVASVTASGLIESSVQVVLDEKRIDELNKKLGDKINDKFNEAQNEIDSAREAIEDGKTQLENGKQTAASQMASAEQQMSDARTELQKGQNELAIRKAQLEEKEAQIAQMEAALAQAEAEYNSLLEKEEGLKALKAEYTSQISLLNEKKADLEGQKEALLAEGKQDTEEYAAIESEIDQLDTSIAEFETASQEVDKQLAEVTVLKAAVSCLGEPLETIRSKITEGRAAITEAKAAIAQAEAQVASGQKSLSEAAAELSKNKALATI